nr:hypothetical protein [Tanacetum cinerariifolium]
MFVLEAHGIPLRFVKVQLSLVALNPKLEFFYSLSDNQMSGLLVDGSSKNLLVFRWEVVQVTLKKKSDWIVTWLGGPPSGNGLLTLCLIMGSSTHIRMKDFDDFKSMAFQVLSFKLGNSSSLTEPVHKCGDVTDDGIDQVGFEVAGRSSSRGFHQSFLKFTLGIWALPMSSSFDDCACSSGAISSSICRSAWVNEIDSLSLTSVIV